MDGVNSTSNLPQRRWGSSGVQDQRSVRPTTASQRPGYSRPMSGRPVSGYGNRLQSRPTTALSAQKPPPPLFLHEPKPGSSTQLPSHLRPVSAVRPLSGRIFLRKTQEKGWIAKNVPEVSYEGLEIEDYDDIGDDTESVDSFFDDDFDTEEQDEKLQRLLTCTTLGVASKGHKQDYVSGEITVPKFHCPRCRDHYYGLTPYPCDEELARLIREGLWRTGETTSPDKSIRRGMMRASLSETNIQKNRKSNSGKDMESSSKIRLPPLNTNNSNMTSSHDAIRGNKDGSAGSHNKKRTKKISFALDNDFGGASPSTSEASLTGHDDGSNSKGRKRRIGDESKKGNLVSANKGSLTSLNDTSSNSSLDRYRMAGHQKKSDNQSSTSKLIDSQTGVLKDRGNSGASLLGSGSNKDVATTSNASELDGETGNARGKGSGGINMDRIRSSNTDGSSTTMLIDQASMTDFTDSNGGTGPSSRNGGTTNGSGFARNDGNASMGSKYGNKLSEATDSDSSKKCNVVNCQNNTNSNKSSAADDGSKKKAPPGYMRAASPSQSEWGDPTHAKKWINNVAPPHPTFRYNNDNDDYEDEFSSQVFNPRGWRHQQKKPSKPESMDDPLLLPIGPRFTRAFTFSYMPGSSGSTKASGSNSAAGGSKKSSRKKTN